MVIVWLVALSVYDIRDRRLPNWLTMPGEAVVMQLLTTDTLMGLPSTPANPPRHPRARGVRPPTNRKSAAPSNKRRSAPRTDVSTEQEQPESASGIGDGGGTGGGGGGRGSGPGNDDESYPLPSGDRVDAAPAGRKASKRATYDEIMATPGAAAPARDPHRYFDRDGNENKPEIAIANWLKRADVKVRSVNERNETLLNAAVKIPDGIIDAAHVTVEFKTVTTPSIRAIRDRIYDAARQSPYVVLDLRPSGVGVEVAKQALIREIGNSGHRLQQIVLILNDDHHLEWRHE